MDSNKKPDYKRFGETFAYWSEEGLPYSMSDLIKLAKECGTPIPGTKEWKEEFPEINLNDEKENI